MTNLVLTEKKSKVGYITINRPEVKNALNLNSIELLTKEIKNFANDQDVKVILLSGQGDEAFCSGADLKELNDRKDIKNKNIFFETLTELITTMLECSKPIICKVHGFCMAGALGMVAASDIVIASEEAKFSLPELKVGMIPGIVMLALENVISKRDLQYLCLSTEMLNASEALRISLASSIVKKSELDQSATALAERMANLSPDGLIQTKKMLNRSSITLRKLFKERAMKMAVFTLSANCKEGISAFLEKRKPNWK